MIDNYVKGKGCKAISQHLHALVTVAADLIKYKIHGTVANLPACDCKRKCNPRVIRRTASMVDKEPRGGAPKSSGLQWAPWKQDPVVIIKNKTSKSRLKFAEMKNETFKEKNNIYTVRHGGPWS